MAYQVYVAKDRGPKWYQRWYWAVAPKNLPQYTVPVRTGWAFTEGQARKACNHAIDTHSRSA